MSIETEKIRATTKTALLSKEKITEPVRAKIHTPEDMARKKIFSEAVIVERQAEGVANLDTQLDKYFEGRLVAFVAEQKAEAEKNAKKKKGKKG